MNKQNYFQAFFLVLSAFAYSSSFAECVVSRDDVLGMIKEGLSADELSQQLEGCVAEESVAASVLSATKQQIKNTGSVFYEALTSCGYQPQRKELTCPIEIRQTFGFGGVPALQPAGSYEYVLFCIDTPAGLTPVNTNGVHVHDESFGVSPFWYTSAVVPADAALFTRPLLGQTMRGRAILSWAVPPANCNAVPIWGNQADFKIRLDP